MGANGTGEEFYVFKVAGAHARTLALSSCQAVSTTTNYKKYHFLPLELIALACPSPPFSS